MSDVGAAATGTVFANLLVRKEEGAVRIGQTDAGGGGFMKRRNI